MCQYTDTIDTKMNKGNTNSSSSSSRSRNWVFTLNNFDTNDIELLKNIQGCKLIFQSEVGKSGTPHLQGAISFNNATHFSSMKKLLPKAHIEKCKNWKASIKYCSKNDTYSGIIRYNNFGLDLRSMDEIIQEDIQRGLRELIEENENRPVSLGMADFVPRHQSIEYNSD